MLYALLAGGAKVTQVDSSNLGLVHYAVLFGRLDLVKSLVAKKAPYSLKTTEWVVSSDYGVPGDRVQIKSGLAPLDMAKSLRPLG